MSDTIEKTAILKFDLRTDEAVKKAAKLGLEITKLRAEQKKTDRTTEDGAKQYQLYTAQIKAHSDELRSTQKDITTRIKLQDSQEKSLLQLKLQLSYQTAQLNKLADTEANYTRRSKLSESIKEISDNLKAQESAYGDNRRNVGGYEDDIMSALSANNQFAGSIFGLVKGEGKARGFFSNVGISIKAFGKTCLGLMKNPGFLAIAGFAGAVGVATVWYNYNKGLVLATKLTQDFTGLSGDGLKEHRIGVQTLADFYQKDFKEVLMSTNALVKQFGIDHVDALAMVKDGFISGADANGEYLQTLKEYPTFFREAGLEASEFVSIVAQTAKSGIHSDKGADAIKESMLSLREMTKIQREALAGIGISADEMQRGLEDGSLSIFEAIKKVSKRIGELPPNSAKVGTAIADIFKGAGEDAGLNFIVGISKIDTNLEEMVKKTAGTLGQLQRESMDSSEELSKSIALMFDRTAGGFEGTVTRAKVRINNILTWVVNAFNTVTSAIAKRIYDDRAEALYTFDSLSAGWDNMVAEIEIGANRLKNIWDLGIGGGAQKIYLAEMEAQATAYESATARIGQSYKERLSLNQTRFKNRFGTDTTLDTGSEGDSGKPKPKPSPVGGDSDVIKKQTKITIETQEAANALLLELHANNFKRRRAIELKAFEESIALQKQAITEALNTEDATKKITQAEADDKYNALIEKMKLFRLKQAKEGNAFVEEQRNQIMSMLDATVGEQVKAIESEYEESIKNVNKILKDIEQPPVRLGFATNEDYNEALKKHTDFVEEKEYSATVLELRLTQERDKKIKEVQKADLERRHALIETKVGELYEDDFIKFQNNEQKKTEILIESLRKQIELKKSAGLDTINEEAQLMAAQSNLNNINANILLAGVMSDAKARYDIKKDLYDKEMKLAEGNVEQQMLLNQNMTDAEGELLQARAEGLEKWGNVAMDAMSAIGDLMSALNERELQELQSKHDKESEMLQSQLDKGIISQEQFDSKQKKLDDDLAKSQAKIAREQAIRERTMALFNIALATAIGIMQSIAASPLTIGMPWTAIIGAMGAVQMAAVLAAPLPKAQRGGYIKGASHANGGVNIEVEGGEAIINKKSTSMFAPLLSAINQAGGGIPIGAPQQRALYDGGFTARHAEQSNVTTKDIAKVVSEVIKNTPIYITVEDFKRGERKYAEVSDYGNLG